MKQVVRVYDRVEVRDVPAPAVRDGFVLVKSECSLISTGSETRALRESQGMFKRLARTSKRVLKKREEASNMGYSCAGRIVAVGANVDALSIGDSVLCSGFDYAVHAELVHVPKNLVAKIPATVTPAQATFATLGSVSLHALRRANIGIGETALVAGLGLTGQLLMRLLRLHGCEAVGVDPNQYKIDLALKHGALDGFCGKSGFTKRIQQLTKGIGVDVAFLCFDTSDESFLEELTSAVRERGKIVAVGNIKSALPFGSLFRKELDITISRSFGPGRFDSLYEEQGHDYPLGYVRWTERRNIQYLLDIIAQKKLVVDDLISARYPLLEAEKAYASLFSTPRPIAIQLTY